MKIIIIDNYDSFTYNLAHYFEDLNCEVTVFRNDEFDLIELEKFDRIVLSPGPGIPDEAGLLKDLIKHYAGKKPILGICLGQQAIAEVFGGVLVNLKQVYHGVSSKISLINESVLFKNLPAQIEVGRYHSWVVSKEKFPDHLTIIAVDENGEIMALKHNSLDIEAVQFHPESILTPNGKQILKNWLNH
jgi:anthranilate synthase component 2